MSNNHKSKVALVTGSSTGIGFEACATMRNKSKSRILENIARSENL
ncbi:hypothetical protein [Candidatus Nitrosocosmicus sp. T]